MLNVALPGDNFMTLVIIPPSTPLGNLWVEGWQISPKPFYIFTYVFSGDIHCQLAQAGQRAPRASVDRQLGDACAESGAPLCEPRERNPPNGLQCPQRPHNDAQVIRGPIPVSSLPGTSLPFNVLGDGSNDFLERPQLQQWVSVCSRPHLAFVKESG